MEWGSEVWVKMKNGAKCGIEFHNSRHFVEYDFQNERLLFELTKIGCL